MAGGRRTHSEAAHTPSSFFLLQTPEPGTAPTGLPAAMPIFQDGMHKNGISFAGKSW
jgi:hypothetical protein